MKVLVLSIGEVRLPGVRHRMCRWADALAGRGHRVDVVFPLLAGSASPTLRRLLRLLELGRAIAKAKHADRVVIYRMTFPFGSMRVLRRVARHLVFDFDDAIYLPSPSEPQGGTVERRYRRNFATTVADVDLVTAGNCTIAEEVQGPRVEIVPTPIDTEFFRPADAVATATQGCVVGWIGTAENLPEWERLALAFRALVERAPSVRFKVICSRPPRALGLPVVFERWSQDQETTHLEDVNIGIMPLADTPWNRGKCAFKALQYMAMGLPVVASGVGMNTEVVEEGRNGFLVGDEADWVDALARLAANSEMQRRMGREGRAIVEQRYACSVIGPRFADLVESVGSSAGAR